MNLLEILNYSSEYLETAGVPKHRLEAEKMISSILGLDRISLYVYFEKELSDNEKQQIKLALTQMKENKCGYAEIAKSNGVRNTQDSSKENQRENLEMLVKSKEYLRRHGVPNADNDAEYIVAHVLNTKKIMLTLNLQRKISEEDKDKIRELLIRRGKNREPLQYILGEWEFYGYTMKVKPNVLIPRGDTEVLVEQCKHILDDVENPKILDIGCGSGAISIALAKEIPTSIVIGVDINDDAIQLSRENAELNNAENTYFTKSDLFGSIPDKKFDLIVSNPPYIASSEYEKLMPEVRVHEPKIALTDGGDGLKFYRDISSKASKYLVDNGYLAFEIGYDQLEKVSEILKDNALQVVGSARDYSGNDRVIIGKYSKEKISAELRI